MQSIISYIREIISKLIKANVKEDTPTVVSADNLISDEMAAHFTLVENLYENRFDRIDWLKKGEVKSLRLLTVISREVASKVCSEADITIEGDSERALYLKKQLELFTKKLPIYVEQGVALGNLALKPYYRNGNIFVSVSKIGSFVPIRADGKGVFDACVFTEKIARNNTWYTRTEYHNIENGVYTVQNNAYRSPFKGSLGMQIPLTEVPEWAEYEPIITLSGDNIEPLYAIYSNPFANSIDIDSPLGISIAADCIDLIKEADETWEAISYEIKSGERRIYLPPQTLTAIGDGTYKLSRFYKEFNADDDNFFHEFSPSFRNAYIENRLQSIFKRIEQNSGLSFGTISDPSSVDRTATEVLYGKERLHNTVKSIQTALKFSISELVDAMDRMCDLYNITPRGEYTLVCQWDDSIIDGKQDRQSLALIEYQAGLIDEVEYFVQARNIQKAEAEALVADIKSRKNEQVGQSWFKDDEGT